MITFIIDDNYNGLLSALFYSFTEKIKPDQVTLKTNFKLTDNSEVISIGSDISCVKRVNNALIRYGTETTAEYLKIALLSCQSDSVKVAFDFAYKTLELRRDILTETADICVAKFNYTVQKIINEQHAVISFLEFEKTKKGVLYASFSPDNDIITLVAPYFFRRTDKMPFLLCDIRRNKIAISNGKVLKYGLTPTNLNQPFSSNDTAINLLWLKYFHTSFIKTT